MNKSLILGITGQDGSYLAEHLLSLGYEVHGVVRRSSVDNLVRIHPILDKVHLHTGDMCDGASIDRVVQTVEPLDIYNLADQDHVGTSHQCPDYSADVTYGAVGRLLESVLSLQRRTAKIRKVFQACSATMFGGSPAPQNEESPLDPRSPYAVAKTAAYFLVKHYRSHHRLFATNAILFNHDSPRRQGDYLLHQIVRGLLRVRAGTLDRLRLENPDLRVDIGHAREFVVGYAKLLALDKPVDVCIGTECAYSITSMLVHARNTIWERGPVPSPSECVEWGPGKEQVPWLKANNTKLVQLTGWSPRMTTMSIITELVEHYRSDYEDR